MYEEITHDTLLEDMQDEVESDVDVTDGSLAYNDLSAAAYEFEKIYRQLDYLRTELDPEQADYDGMVLLAKQRYLSPRQPTHAIGKMTCNPAIDTGLRFSIGDYTYTVTGKYDDGTYACTCDQTGSGPNSVLGEMDPIDYINNFVSAELTEITTKGQDLETKDSLYQRYIANLHADSFAGNASAYESYCLNHDGVGGVKVYGAWKGGSTALLVLLDSENKPVTQTFCDNLLKEICPEKYKGKGMAPIGADVTIKPAESVACNMNATFTFKDSYTFDTCKDNIIAAEETYLSSIRAEWSGGDETTKPKVYVSRLIAALLNVTGVVDVADLKLNGSTDNLELEWDQVPVAGSVTNV